MATTNIKNGFQGGSDDQLLVNPDGSINVNSSGSGGNASVGPTGDPAPTDATLVGGITDAGDLEPLHINDNGELKVTGNVTGSIQPEGLNIAGRITTMEVMVMATPLPAVPLANRNAMSITNLSNEVLYIGFDASVTADSVVGTTSGWEIGPNEGFNIDVQGSIPIYGIAATGPILVKIMELS